MRNDSTEKIFNLIILLLDTTNRSVDELCSEAGISRRTFYYLMEFLRSREFIIFKSGGYYHIDRRSPFISKITNSIQFSNNELLTIWNLLGMVGTGNDTVNKLRHKLDVAYDFSRVTDNPQSRRMANSVKKLSAAIDRKRMVRLLDYSSPHSHSVRDRIVEPYLLMNNDRDVRCHEISSGINKTFKIARMSGVEILDTPWIHEDLHRQVFTDIFMFSGEKRHTVMVRLGLLSRNLFLEEYPQASKCVQQDGDDADHWILKLDVCDYRGIGRFVMGLFEDVEVLGDDSFIKYIGDKVTMMYNKIFPDKSQAEK